MFKDLRYGEMLKAFYPDIKDRMIAFEDDAHARERIAMGGEGPDEIVARTLETIHLLDDLAAQYHSEHPGRRLVFVDVTHYDSISPLVKTLAEKPKSDYQGVDSAAGITIDVDPGGRATTKIGDATFELPRGE